MITKILQMITKILQMITKISRMITKILEMITKINFQQLGKSNNGLDFEQICRENIFPTGEKKVFYPHYITDIFYSFLESLLFPNQFLSNNLNKSY